MSRAAENEAGRVLHRRLREPRQYLMVLLVSAALLFLVLPGHPLAWLKGLPLGGFGLSILVAFGLLLVMIWPLPGTVAGARRLLVALGALCVLKTALAVTSPSYGLEASYFGKPGSSGPPERSTEFSGLGATRLDQALSFEGNRFPLYFFNDNLRFNYYQGDEPDRETLPFAVRWRGFLDVPRDRQYRFRLSAAGSARVDLGEGAALALDTGGQVKWVEQRLQLPAGLRPVQVEYTRVAGAPAFLVAEWDADGALAPLRFPRLLAAQSSLPPALSQLWFGLARAVDLAYLATFGLLAVLLARARRAEDTCSRTIAAAVPGSAPAEDSTARPVSTERVGLAFVLILVFLYAIVTSLELHDRVVLLEGGSDFLTYETYARDIQLNGPLMTLGRPLGRGRPYFFQPFYPYALAIFHGLIGEDLYGPVVLQLFGIGLAAVLVYLLGKRLFGWPSGVAAAALLLGLLGPFQLDWVARHLLSENIYFWLLPASALALLKLADRPSGLRALLAGALLGLCCVTRGPTLLWAPPALLTTYVLLRQRTRPVAGPARAAYYVGAATLACTLVVLLVPLRNYVVASQPSLLATNGISTMELAHPLTPKVDLRGVEKLPVYRALKLDFAVVQMIEFVRQDPGGYLETLGPLVLYALGFPEHLEPGSRVRWELAGLVGLYLLSLAFPAARRLDALILHSFIGLHFLVMLVFLPNVYGFRQVLPMYVFLVVFAGFVLMRAAGLLVAQLRRLALEDQDRHGQGREVEPDVPPVGATTRHKELA